MSKLISICIPTYRRPSQLLHAIHSCISQNYRPIEIEIGDDSSQDDSEELVASLLIPEGVSVRYVRNRPALGQAGNVNSLFTRARGNRLVLLHDDDVLAPAALQSMNEVFDRNEDAIAVYGMQQIISERGETDPVETVALNNRYRRTKEFVGVHRDTVLCALWRQFPNDGYLVDTGVARAVGFRSFEEIGNACDTDFGIRLGLYSRGKAFILIDQITCRYRVSSDALSGSREMSWRLYCYLQSLSAQLTPHEAQARDDLLAAIAVQALIENAVHGRRREALMILASRHYSLKRKWAFIRMIYHVGLILFPQLDRARPKGRRVWA